MLHKLIVNGVETKTKDIPQAIRIKPEYVYSICTEKQEPILINNIPVLTGVTMNG